MVSPAEKRGVATALYWRCGAAQGMAPPKCNFLRHVRPIPDSRKPRVLSQHRGLVSFFLAQDKEQLPNTAFPLRFAALL